MLEIKAQTIPVEEVQLASKDEPVMYKLCRIDENGTAHPMTDEDFMEVESLIQAEYSEDNEPEQSDDDCLDDINGQMLDVQVLDSVMLKVKTEDDQRTPVDSSGSGYNGAKLTYTRRRRPSYTGAVECKVDVPASELHLVEVKTEPLLEEEGPCSSSKILTTVPVMTQPEHSYQAHSNKLCLDNLSIRELQDTYRDTFGRETSAKDKHWLKRKIAKGLNHAGDGSRIQELLTQQAHDMMFKERLDEQLSAEQPCAVIIKPEFESDVKLLPQTTISPTGSLDASTTTVVSRPSDGYSNVNEVQSLEGKRQRKPNRRYLEEEMEEGFEERVSSPETQDQADQPEYAASPYEMSEEEEEEDEEDEDEDEDDDEVDLALEPLDSLLPDEPVVGDRKRGRGFGAERRAAQLVKMARNARAARRDANNPMRKIKFKLPSASAQDNDENYEPTEDSDQVSCMLPNMSSDELQPSDAEDIDNPRKSGSRRKHHRPWTLREVMALVDGVSRCGTGKWADIKRLSFSAIAYRTPVDLKDKWRNLLRASRVHTHSSRQQQGEKRRKHFSVSIPAPILARVRELAAQPGQTLKLPVIRSTRTRRMGRKQSSMELD